MNFDCNNNIQITLPIPAQLKCTSAIYNLIIIAVPYILYYKVIIINHSL